MNPIPVRNLFNLKPSEIVNLKTGFPILFEDGVVIDAKPREIIVFRYFMDFVTKLKEAKKMPIISDMFISKHYEEGYFNSGTYTGMFSVVFKTFTEHVAKKYSDGRILIRELLKEIYKATNKITKDLVPHLGEYVIGVEVQDILEVQFHKELLDSIVEVTKHPDQHHIEQTYNVLDDIVRNKLDNKNIIRLIYLSKMVNLDQLRQLFGSRGFLTEINSRIFALPMTNSFTLGAKNIYELAIESRAGAKALFLSSRAIQDSEYMARELQLATMVAENLVIGDCGSKEYVDYYVTPKEVDPVTGKLIYKGDLKNLIGKRFLNPNTGKEEVITKDHTWLEGQTIKLRSAVNCKLRDKKQICSACYGELAYSLFPHQNVGHVNTVNITKPISQSIISTKHLTKSASSGAVEIDNSAKKYFTVKDKNKLVFLSKYFGRKTKHLRIHIPQEQAFGLKDVLQIGNILKINLNKVSRLSDILIEETGNKAPVFDPINLKSGNKFGFFTTYFWQYVIKHGYEIDEFDNYVVDLENWDYKKPIIQYEKMEFDFATLSKEFKKLIKTRKYYKVNGVKRAEFTPDVLVQKLFDLVNKKLDINIALLEALVYPFTAWDINNENYDLGRNSPNNDLVGLKYAIDYRSIGGSYGWSKLQAKIADPALHEKNFKPDHPLDVLFKPNEVIKIVGEK